MKFGWAYEIIYVYSISNVVFPSVKMMFINKLLNNISNVIYLTNCRFFSD